MSNSISKTFSTIIILISLSGCVGVGVVKSKTISWDEDSKDNAGFGLCPVSQGKNLRGCNKDEIHKMTPGKISELWGQPKSDKNTNGYREIIYNKDIAFRGLLIFVGVPLPLLSPVGHNEARFLYKDDRLVHVDYTYGEPTSAVCGLHSEGPNGFGCIAGWH